MAEQRLVVTGSNYNGECCLPGFDAIAAPTAAPLESLPDGKLVAQTAEGNSFTLLLDHGRHSRNVHIENNSFRNSNIIVWGNNGGPILQGARPLTAIRNTVRDMGFSGMGRPGANNTIELNQFVAEFLPKLILCNE